MIPFGCLPYPGNFITLASDTYAELGTHFDSTDSAVRALKRYFGETVLGCTPPNGSEAIAVSAGVQEDPWSSFFILVVKFAQMYKTAIVELVEWEKQEERIRQQAIENSKRKASHAVKLKRVAEAEKVLELKVAAAEKAPARPSTLKPNKSRANSRDGAPADVMQVWVVKHGLECVCSGSADCLRCIRHINRACNTVVDVCICISTMAWLCCLLKLCVLILREIKVDGLMQLCVVYRCSRIRCCTYARETPLWTPKRTLAMRRMTMTGQSGSLAWTKCQHMTAAVGFRSVYSAAGW